MPEENDSEIIDLGFDANEADLKYPILRNGTYLMKVKTVKSKTSEKGHKMIVVQFALAQPGVKDADGKDVAPGFVITQNYLVNPTGGLTKDMIERRFKQLHFATAGEGRVNTSAWVGKTLSAQVKLTEAKDGYDARNEIASVAPVKHNQG